MKPTVRAAFLFLGLIALGLLFIGGCGGKKANLEDGFQHARLTLMRAGKDPLAAGSLASIEEMGGHPVDYVIACLPEKPAFSSFEREKPTHPWTVVIKMGPGGRQYLIAAYGEDLEKPLKEESITVSRPPPQ